MSALCPERAAYRAANERYQAAWRAEVKARQAYDRAVRRLLSETRNVVAAATVRHRGVILDAHVAETARCLAERERLYRVLLSAEA